MRKNHAVPGPKVSRWTDWTPEVTRTCVAARHHANDHPANDLEEVVGASDLVEAVAIRNGAFLGACRTEVAQGDVCLEI